MSLLFIDSFDHYATADLPLKWSAVVNSGTSVTIDATAGRRGGGGVVVPGFCSVRKDLPGAKTLIAGFAMKMAALPAALDVTSPIYWLNFANSDGVHLAFAAGPDGALVVYRRSGTLSTDWTLLGTTTAAVLQANVNAYIEVKATISATTAGAVKVLVNGVTVLNLINIKTIYANTTNEQTTRVTLTGITNNSTLITYDDLYICDTAGTVNNDFFGDVRIDVTRPNADGTYADFTPDSGTVHYSRVNEAIADQLTYVSGGTVGAKDSYQFTDLATIVSTVRGVQIVDAAVKDDAGPRSISHLAKSGVSEQFSAAIPLSTDRKLYTTIHETDPATGEKWTQSGLNAAEFGVVVAA